MRMTKMKVAFCVFWLFPSVTLLYSPLSSFFVLNRQTRHNNYKHHQQTRNNMHAFFVVKEESSTKQGVFGMSRELHKELVEKVVLAQNDKSCTLLMSFLSLSPMILKGRCYNWGWSFEFFSFRFCNNRNIVWQHPWTSLSPFPFPFYFPSSAHSRCSHQFPRENISGWGLSLSLSTAHSFAVKWCRGQDSSRECTRQSTLCELLCFLYCLYLLSSFIFTFFPFITCTGRSWDRREKKVKKDQLFFNIVRENTWGERGGK